MSAYNMARLLVLMLTVSPAVWGDDIDTSISQGREAYQHGDVSQAIGRLEYALQRLRQRNSERLAMYLPSPLPGWEALGSRAGVPSGAVSSNYSAAEREYYTRTGLVNVRIEMDSPAIHSVAMLASNPAYAKSTGATVKHLAGYKAVIHYDCDAKDGDISLLVDNQYLVTVEGDGVSLEELEAYLTSVGLEQLPRREP